MLPSREEIQASERQHEKNLVRMRQARDHFRTGVSMARTAVHLAEGGHGWKYIAQLTGVDEKLARLLVLGTD